MTTPHKIETPEQPSIPLTETTDPPSTLQVPGPEFIHPVHNGQPAEHPQEDEARPEPSSHPGFVHNASAFYANTQVRYEDADFRTPPPLNYSLHPRKKSIAIFWSLIILDCVCMPIALYFGLWYGTSLSPNAVFSISTGALGSVSIVEYFLRFYRLWKKGSTCRVIGARRFYLDWFHWNLSVAWFFIMIELIAGTVPKNPPIRLLAMPAPTMAFALGVELLIIDIMRLLGMRAPCRISSLPMGAPLRPGIYAIIEDVCAVDGSGGTEFRQRLNLRYQASRMFRQMLHRLTLFWAFGAVGVAAVSTAIIFTVSRDVAYVLGWTIPFVWAGVWAFVTTKWVQKSLRAEYANWQEVKWKS
ncbi:hypothetical protein K432DRAFT_355609 [Lepidopterella palustris CBS 459.81]|uniref:Uncharacterized protein n=1 Tax=Lepidopterella palustris CBS 459.81 TaxID=1314670 RepID=A0A8E2E8L0_9PEZI|nr:hypothetical protein K432DRAFT_355609 [Lepidopterella palustris CBS 459.81]